MFFRWVGSTETHHTFTNCNSCTVFATQRCFVETADLPVLYQTLWRWHLPVDPWRMGVADHGYPHQATLPLLVLCLCVPHYLQPAHVLQLQTKESQPTYQFFFQHVVACGLQFTGVDLSLACRQYHADLHSGEDAAVKAIFVNADRVADWAHVMGACQRSKPPAQGLNPALEARLIAGRDLHLFQLKTFFARNLLGVTSK